MGRELEQLTLTFVSLVQNYNCEVAFFTVQGLMREPSQVLIMLSSPFQVPPSM